MLARARQILVSELTFALNVDEETAESRLDDVLAGKEVKVEKTRRRAPAKTATRKAAAKPAKATARRR